MKIDFNKNSDGLVPAIIQDAKRPDQYFSVFTKVDIVYVETSSFAIAASSSISSSYALTSSYVKGPIASASFAERSELTRRISFVATNDDNVTIPAGTPLYVMNVTPHNVYNVRRANASDPNRMPAVGVAATTSAPGESTELIVLGEVKNLDTFGSSSTHVQL